MREHPRTIGWLGTSALAMGGSNQMVFLVGALIAKPMPADDVSGVIDANLPRPDAGPPALAGVPALEN